MECLMVDNTGKDRGYFRHTEHKGKDMKTPDYDDATSDEDDGKFDSYQYGASPPPVAPVASPSKQHRSGEDITAVSMLQDHLHDLCGDYACVDKITAIVLMYVGELDRCITEWEEQKWDEELIRMKRDREEKKRWKLEEQAEQETGPYVDFFSDVRLLHSKDGFVKVSSLNGKYVALYFGGSWCPACIHYFPKLKKAYEAVKAAGHNFEIVYLSCDRDEQAFNNYYAKHPWLAVPYVAQYVERKLSQQFGVRGIPTIVLLDENAKMYEMDGRSKVLSPEKFPWNQLPPEVQTLMDITNCNRSVAESTLRSAFLDLNRAVEYVFAAQNAPEIPVKSIVEVITSFATDFSDNNFPLKVGDRLSVLRVDEDGDLTVMHLSNPWPKPGFIARWNFEKIRIVTRQELEDELKAERAAALEKKRLNEMPLLSMDANEEIATNSSIEPTESTDSDMGPKPLLKKRSTMMGSFNAEHLELLKEAMGPCMDEKAAREALRTYNNDVEAALELLLSRECKIGSEDTDGHSLSPAPQDPPVYIDPSVQSSHFDDDTGTEEVKE